MKHIEPVVKKWYDALEEGKLMGMRCKDCGHYEFPPVPICNACGSTKIVWVEMSGKGTMISCEIDNVPTYPHEERGPLLAGFVELEEGPAFISWLIDVDEEDQDGITAKLPFEVEFVAQKRDTYSYPVFRQKN